jgi:hypothetical protein
VCPARVYTASPLPLQVRISGGSDDVSSQALGHASAAASAVGAGAADEAAMEKLRAVRPATTCSPRHRMP